MARFLLALLLVPVFVVGASAEGLEVYLPLNGNSLDASGHGRDGTVVVRSAFASADWVTAQVGQGLDLSHMYQTRAELEANKTDGAYVEVDYTLPESGTIAVWYQVFDDGDPLTDNSYHFQTLWDNSGHGGDLSWDVWEAWIQRSDRLFVRVADGVVSDWANNPTKRSTFIDLGNNHMPVQGSWFHFASTWERTSETTVEFDAYVNGVLVPNEGVPTTTPWTIGTCYDAVWQDPGSTFYLGGGNDGNTYAVGVFDELGIWSTRLDATQVAAVYTKGVLAALPTPGDANRDGDVDDEDASILGSNWLLQSGATWDMGDFNNDQIVDDRDAAIMAAHWSTPGEDAAVPEPSTLVLLLGIVASLAFLRRNR